MIYRKRLFAICPNSSDKATPLFDDVRAALRREICAWAGAADVDGWPTPAEESGKQLTAEEWTSPGAPDRQLLTVDLAETRDDAAWTLRYTLGTAGGHEVLVAEECQCDPEVHQGDANDPPDLTGFLAPFDVRDVDNLKATSTYSVAQGAEGRLMTLIRKDRVQRRLPVVLISHTREGETPLDARSLGRRLRGLAHVLTLEPSFWWHADDIPHKCFGGTVRLYNPGYQATQRQGEHPFWPVSTIKDEGADAVERQIVAAVLQATASVQWDLRELDGLEKERRDALTEAQTQQRLSQMKAEILAGANAETNELFEELHAEHQRVVAERDEYRRLLRDAEAERRRLKWELHRQQSAAQEEPPPEPWEVLLVQLSRQAANVYSELDRPLQLELDTKVLSKLADEGLTGNQSEPVRCADGVCFVYPRSRSAAGSRAIFRTQGNVVQVLELYRNHDDYEAARDRGFVLADYFEFAPWRSEELSAHA